MIISHSSKFIFIKPEKVAGTSVQVALTNAAVGSKDIVTSIGHSKKVLPECYKAKNYKEYGFRTHSYPSYIKDIIGKKLWNLYFKITVIRNPWETLVSKYKHLCGNNKDGDPEFLKKYPSLDEWVEEGCILTLKNHRKYDLFCGQRNGNTQVTNEVFYWDKNNLISDFHIRYEHLVKDLEVLKHRYKINVGVLPKLKVSTDEHHYSAYMSSKAVRFIEEKCEKTIIKFNYNFERIEKFNKNIDLANIKQVDYKK